MDSEMRDDYPAIAAYDLVLVGAIVARESGRLQVPEDLFWMMGMPELIVFYVDDSIVLVYIHLLSITEPLVTLR